MSECPHGLFDVCCTNYERCTLGAPKKKWVGLTDEEIYEIYEMAEEKIIKHWESGGTTMMFPLTVYKAFEAKLKEKNSE
jgi:hypothetical protein